MDFEFDPVKSASNLVKHGIDFTEAQQLWLDQNRLEVRARTQDEPRWLLIASYNSRFWSAVFTYRPDRIRIISVRRARQKEITLYEDQ
ncbi:BrnT family toxin [Corynebacterium variabile]|uniref:Toxin n=1 Tax=Corynebacterium variabile TaxID=1727 RepID=A0A4Y4C577_9CORY|nr:BrnT family toxin [Corynebacterium variabile]GEC86283.1 toxin [Corynebacterium variabile]